MNGDDPIQWVSAYSYWITSPLIWYHIAEISWENFFCEVHGWIAICENIICKHFAYTYKLGCGYIHGMAA